MGEGEIVVVGSNFWYIFAAYTIVWLVVFGMVLALYVRERALRQEVDALRYALQARERGDDGARTGS